MQLGMSLFSGRAGPAWAARAERVRKLLLPAIGDGAPDIPGVSAVATEPPAYPRLTPPYPGRALAIEAAENIADAVARRRFDRLAGLIHDELWVLWPNGAMGRHPGDAVLQVLSASAGSRATLRIKEKRSYSFPELKTALARGIPEVLDALLGANGGWTVTIEVETKDSPIGRLMFLISPNARGELRARNLPFGAPDDAHVLSAKPSSFETEELKIADRIVRNVVLGQTSLLRANKNDLMESFWLRDKLAPAEQLATSIAQGPHRIGSAEVVFQGSREAPFRDARRHMPPPVFEEIRRKAPDVLGRAIERLDPRVVVTEMGTLDPATGEVTAAQTAASLIVHVEDRATQNARPRIAGLFI
jgi:hypothetical protein